MEFFTILNPFQPFPAIISLLVVIKKTNNKNGMLSHAFGTLEAE